MNKMELSSVEIELLIVGFLTGSITPEELKLLQLWMGLSPENRKHFNRIKDAWIASGKTTSMEDKENSWVVLRDNIQVADMQEPLAEKGGKNLTGTIRMAASWLLFFIAGAGITWFISNRQNEDLPKIVEVSAPLGSRSFIKMPDGTKIWLNAGTTLTYDENYGDMTRTLYLTGEAFFDVAKDKEHPFVVNTSGIIIRALGTRFNVKAYPDEKTVAATLEEGKIDIRVLAKSNNNKQIVLKEKEKLIVLKEIDAKETYTENADEKIFMESGSVSAEEASDDISLQTNVNTELYTSWKDPRWIIQGELLGTLAPMLERRFNLQIVFGDEELKNYKFSGTIENETVDQIMKLLTLTAPIEFAINKDTITLNLNKFNIDEFGKTMTRHN